MAAKKKIGPFIRPDRGHRSTKKDEIVPIVRVHVIPIRKGNKEFFTGNISRSFSIYDAKVSEVARIVEQALFGDG